MDDPRKLETAIGALRTISSSVWNSLVDVEAYASRMLDAINQPETERVRDIYWLYISPDGEKTVCSTKPEVGEQGCKIVQMVSDWYERPIPSEVVWEGMLAVDNNGRLTVLFKDYPKSKYDGRYVEVKLLKEEE